MNNEKQADATGLEEAMKAYYQGKIADVWEIGRQTPQPDWVKDAFQKQYICCLDEHVRILMTGLNPSVVTNLKIGATGTAGGGICRLWHVCPWIPW